MIDTQVLAASPVALRPGEGEPVWFLGALVTIKAVGEQSAGGVCVVEVDGPQGMASPVHVHRREDEWFYVIEGEVSFYVGDDVFEASAGSFVYGPRDLAHAFVIDSAEGARFLMVTEPAGFEDFVRAASVPAEALTRAPAGVEPPSPEKLTAICTEYGIEVLGPPPNAVTAG